MIPIIKAAIAFLFFFSVLSWTLFLILHLTADDDER